MHPRSINHVRFSPTCDFADFIKRFEEQLGHHDLAAYQHLLQQPGAENRVEEILRQQEGTSGFVLLATFDHGELLRIRHVHLTARHYVIGNPLYAARLIEHDIRAALYVTLSVLVYVDEFDRLQVEYDQPSTVLTPLCNLQIDAIARDLDVKIANVIEDSSVVLPTRIT